LLAAKTKIAGVDSPLDLNCKTNYIEVGTDESEMVKKAIADEIYWCWYQFAEGKADFISDWDWSFWNVDASCFICSKIDISQKTAQLQRIPIGEFEQYLDNALTVPQSGTYSEYLTGKENGHVDLGSTNPIILDSNSPLYVVFIAQKKSKALTTIEKLSLGLSGAGTTTSFAFGVLYKATRKSELAPGWAVFQGNDAVKQCSNLEVFKPAGSP
jgi:hypothetical protein